MIDAVADQLAQKLDDEYLAAAREAAEHAAASSSPSNHDSSARSQPTANGISGSQSSSNHERFVDQAIFRSAPDSRFARPILTPEVVWACMSKASLDNLDLADTFSGQNNLTILAEGSEPAHDEMLKPYPMYQ